MIKPYNRPSDDGKAAAGVSFLRHKSSVELLPEEGD